ncbi:hypothetical protein DAPPUDRAFT_250562 [Daphnia pulex]|uniref:Uncharacterized protein n=1 Tax=Daphnia pulex TaxID=6669 RepID=E9GYU1_DAPPU|nr:hypothetical protein DAPPUDRAFT_250562 [Daphnia pulex]|eukprot:EFX75351.1 hypothetical protein DAPPUDRAFT_250562 [Daphnia pulex]
MKRTAAIDTLIAEGTDFSNFYGDEEDPYPEQINEDNGAIEVTRMLEEMESPSRKKLKIAEDKDTELEEILYNRNWTDSAETKILLDIMVSVLMKDAKVLNRSDGDFSIKWRNMKARYNQLRHGDSGYLFHWLSMGMTLATPTVATYIK